MSQVEEKLAELGHTLPEAWPPGKLDLGVPTGNLIFLSGAGSEIRGTLGRDLGVEEGYRAAQECCLQLLANLKEVIGDLDKVTRIVKLLGMVSSTPDFVDQPDVVHGCTDMLIEVFGEKGRHGRSAVGMASLPGGRAVEIEMIVEVSP